MGEFRWKTIGMLILVALLIWTEMPTTGFSAAPLIEGDFEYTDNGDGTATITGYTGIDIEIDIPEKLNDLTVTRIGSGTFREKELTGTSVKTYAEANNHAFEPLNTFADGSGTEGDPYIIITPEQLDAVRHDLQAHYKLGANIDLSDYQSGAGWEPIAEEYNPTNHNTSFHGSFDGNGHAITGLTINRDSDYQGLFAAVGETGMIRNVRLDHVAISGGNYIGGLAGINYGIIENSSVNGGIVDGEYRVGGLVGWNSGAAITSSFAAVNVSGDTYIGGLIGENIGSNGETKTIGYSYGSGEVAGNVHVGGLIGRNETANDGSTNEIISSYATGKVTAKRQAGGLVGGNFSYPGGTIRIKNSYATGEVYGEEQYSGGLIGYNRSNAYPGSTIEVVHSYAMGEVTGAADVGGLVGQNAPSPGTTIAIDSSYWNESAYEGATPDNGIGTPKTAAELTERDMFADWDFTNAWYQYNEQTTPFLQWQNPIVSWDVDIAKDVLVIDESTKITVNVTHENNESYAGTDVAAYSVNPEVASVDQGTVTALRGGIAVITVSLFGESRTIDLTVDGGKPTEPTITLDSEGWTNATEVKVTIEHESTDDRLNQVQTIRVKVGAAGWQDYAYGDLPIVLEVAAEGTTLIQAQAIDELGNTSDIAEQRVKISRSGLMVEPRLTYADDDQEEYVSGTWTRRSVTADVYAGHTQGLTVTSVVYSLDAGATWVPYTEPLTVSEEGDHSLWVKAQDEADNEIAGQIRIRVDRTTPAIRFVPDGSEGASRNISGQVTVTDDGSGVNEATLRYVWSTSPDSPDEQADWQGFLNGNTLNRRGASGDWYLHIRAMDDAGNEGYAVSERFRIRADNQGGSGGTYVGSNNAKLSELILSEGRLTPAFSEDVTEYETQVEHDVQNLILTVRAAHRLAAIQVNDEALTNDQENVRIPLIEGTNLITILITAEDGTHMTYTLTIVRMRTEQDKPEPPQRSFADITGHWAERSIREAVLKGFIHGYPDSTFKPDHPITRAEFTVMLAGALRLDGEGTVNAFADSEQIGLWAKEAVVQAVWAGIVTGYEDGGFRPNLPVTRAEMAVMIARTLQSPTDADTVTDFSDDEDIPHWAKSAVEAARKLGFVNGRGGNRFVPMGESTRAEAAVLLLRLLEYKGGGRQNAEIAS